MLRLRQSTVKKALKRINKVQLNLQNNPIGARFQNLILFIATFAAGYIFRSNQGVSTTNAVMNTELQRSKALPIIDQRDDLANILQDENKKIGLEIGVQKGNFAHNTLSRWTNCEKYYLVDAWTEQKHYKDMANKPQHAQDKLFQETKNRLQEFEKRGTELIYLRNFSNIAVNEIPNDSLDWIYVDARHDFQGVSEDLRLYWPKLKKNGILSGHDFVNADEEPKRNGQDWCIFADGTKCENNQAVKAAVEIFAKEHGKQVIVPRREHKWPSWYLRK